MPTISPRGRNAPPTPNRNATSCYTHCALAHTCCVKTHDAQHTNSLLHFSPYGAITRACVCMGVGIRIDAYRCIGLRRAVSHAGGLSCMLWYVGLGMGVRAVLGPVQRRFAFVLIQTTQPGLSRRLSNEYQSQLALYRNAYQIL